MTQSKSTSTKKGILVATIGDLTGLLSGPYENIYYYINDHLGTPQMLTDSSAIVAWQADYDPFGKATVNDDPDGNSIHVTNNIRFPGQYYDTETGLHYNYHRYYDPGIGRYLSPDPIGLAGGINLFVYVENNSINFTDPLGLVCGSSWNDRIVPDAPKGYDFTSCCQRHDNCYDKKCSKTKEQCDDEFYECMKRQCDMFHPGNKECFKEATRYWYFVDRFGRGPYKKLRKKPPCSQCP